MRLGKTIVVGVGLYAMRLLLNRARAKQLPLDGHDTGFADTEPAAHPLPHGDEPARALLEEDRLTVLKP
jgi:hypothetical protein